MKTRGGLEEAAKTGFNYLPLTDVLNDSMYHSHEHEGHMS